MKNQNPLLNHKLKQLEPLIEKLKGIVCEKKRLEQIGVAQEAEDIVIRSLQLTGGDRLLPLLNLERLREVDQFYLPIGGLIGYYYQALQLLLNKGSAPRPLSLSRAPGFDLDHVEHRALREGLQGLAGMGEMYPIGGLATRLDFRGPTGDPLPAALLPFGGFSLLERLIRDVEGRERLYYKIFDRKITIPIALMTSDENEEAIREMLEHHHWFNRSSELFFIFRQPSVPVLTQEGEWVLASPSKLAMQPGGHGAIWQAALQQGVFDWFMGQGKRDLLIRQINNPLGGLDHALLSLVGLGKREGKAFGFLSCERDPKVAEGVLALVEDESGYRISNIEYTEIAAHGIDDITPLSANTNMLYVNLDRILPILKSNPLPGFLLNMKDSVEVASEGQLPRQVLGGRLENMMQSLSDHLQAKTQEELPTFLAYQKRERTIASAKKKFTGSLPETPEGAFYRLLCNHYELLKRCSFDLPPLCSEEQYLEEGPSILFHYHPHVGPLYSIIVNKMKRGRFAKGAELLIEPSDIFIEQLLLVGSLLIEGEGKCVLKQVSVQNKGVPPRQQAYWRCQYERKEALAILVHGNAEFHAEGVEIKGNQLFEVPAGERWILTSKGLTKKPLERETWSWHYQLTAEGQITCLLS